MRFRHHLAVAAVLLGGLAGPGAHAAAPAGYAITDLGVVGNFTQSYGYGLSDSGAYVTGWLATTGGATQAFRWSAGGGMELLALGAAATASRGFGINDAGVVAGEMAFGSRREATLWGSVPAGLGTLSNSGSSVAFAVNNAGQVAGWSDSSAGTRAFTGTAAAGISSLGTLPDGTQSRGYAINSGGAVAGWGTTPAGDRGFLAAPALQSVGPASPLAGSSIRAFGISNNRWVTGDASLPGLGTSAFAWSVDAGFTSLGRLTGAANSFGGDINANATAVGWNDGLAAGEAAFVWSAGYGMVDLNTLLVNGAGWHVQRARSINDAGWIVGQAVDSLGNTRAVLLTPVPEPATAGLMLGGAAALFAAVRRRVR